MVLLTAAQPPTRAPPGGSAKGQWQWMPNPLAVKGKGKGKGYPRGYGGGYEVYADSHFAWAEEWQPKRRKKEPVVEKFKPDPEALEAVELFLAENEVDEKARKYLRERRPEVQRLVLEGGTVMGARKPSSALMSRISIIEESITNRDPEIVAAVDRFLDENPVDARASEMLRTQRPDVQVAVMQEGDLTHCTNPSGALISRLCNHARMSKESRPADLCSVSNLFWWKSYDPVGIAIGRVKLKRKDFSFLVTNEAPGKDIYAHETTVQPELLGTGDIIAFKSHHAPEFDGPEADWPVWKLFGPLIGPPDFGVFLGHVNKVLENGAGFVNCSEVTAAHGHNAFIHSQVMEQCGLQRDDVIAFHVHVNKEGMPQVSSPVWKCITDMSDA